MTIQTKHLAFENESELSKDKDSVKLQKAIEEQKKVKNLIDLFMLALFLVFLIYAVF